MTTQQNSLDELQIFLHKKLSDNDYIYTCTLIKSILDNIKSNIVKYFDLKEIDK